MSGLALKRSEELSKPSDKSVQRRKVADAIARTGRAMQTALGATSWAVGNMATGGEFGRMMNRRLDEKVRKELTTKGVSKKRGN